MHQADLVIRLTPLQLQPEGGCLAGARQGGLAMLFAQAWGESLSVMGDTCVSTLVIYICVCDTGVMYVRAWCEVRM